jgi:PAS domain S-box-containing protein
MEIPVPASPTQKRPPEDPRGGTRQAAESGHRPRHEPASRAAEVGIWEWDLIGNTFIYSATARALCGLPPGDEPLSHEDIRRITHPDDLPRTSAAARRALDPAIRESVAYEYRIILPAGGIRWVTAQGEAFFETVDGVERAVRYVGTLHDATEMRRLREALETSESRLRLAIGGGRMAVWELDLETDAVVGSPELNRLLGFALDTTPSAEEIRSRYAPGERERIRALGQERLALGERFLEVEFRYLWPCEEVRWLLLRAEIHRDVDCSPRAVGVLIDITDRHRVEDALRRSEARLKLAQKAANSGVWEWNPRTGIASWSPEMYSLLGLDPALDAGDPHRAWLEVLHPEDRHFADSAGPRALSDGQPFTFDFRIVRRGTGEVRWIRSHGAVVADDDGTPSRVIGVNLDVTDAHRHRQALEERNRALELSADRSRRERERMFELSQDLFAAVGFDGYLKVVNPAWSRILGHDEATLLGRPLIELVHPEERASCAALMGGMRHGEASQRFERRMLCAEGAWRWLDWTAVSDGELIYAVGRDVSAERQAAEALEEANRQLLAQIRERERMEETLRQVQRLEAVGQLTAGVAHDFNNLLTVVLGNIEFVERATRDPKLQQRLGFMRQAALRGATLTAQLLAFSRRQRLEPKPVDLNGTVEGMSELLKSTMGGSVRLTTILKPDPWSALVDPTQIELVILNLAINARDAMPVGGSLTVEASNVTLTEPPRWPGEPPPGDYVAISVADTGEGMSEQVRARAFEPFFTTKEVGKGSGLGLAQVLGFAQQSGGGVRIESAPGAGTTVSVYLPRVAVHALVEQASLFAESAATCSHNRLVLLVDDDTDVREVTATRLRALGFQVIDADSGVEALDLLEHHPAIELLVADFAMPGMNGAEVARRARERRPDLPVVFVTGYADQSALAGIGDAYVVQKPFRDDELERKIGALLVRHGGGRLALPREAGDAGERRREGDAPWEPARPKP